MRERKTASRVVGTSPYRPDNATSAAVAISSLRDASSQTVPSGIEDVNIMSQSQFREADDMKPQPEISEDPLENEQGKYIHMTDVRFFWAFDEDIIHDV